MSKSEFIEKQELKHSEVNTNITKTNHKQEISHEVTIFAEPVFHIGNFTITNALLNTWIVVFLLSIFAIFLRKKLKTIPKGIQNFFEIIIDYGLNLCDNVTGDRKKSLKIFPIVFTLFIFIIVNNYLGLLPGIGSIGFIENIDGHKTFIPMFRGGTADLNTTLGLAIFAVILSNIFGVIMVGAWNYFNKFININALTHPFKNFRKNYELKGILGACVDLLIDIFVGIIKFSVGLIEIVSEIAKVASLSFRLFGNIFAGEVLLSSIAVIMAFLVPIPFMFLELIVGLVQAMVFSILVLVYFTIASMEVEH